jgi:SAM-dependent methyltransferase
MLDLVAKLPAGSRVLDLGAAGGSFATSRDDILVVRVDREIPSTRAAGSYVSADAARLPFDDGIFDLAISNHSLEHFVELEPAVRELGRVLKPGGALYAAVPDAGTLTDRIYRWLARGGGHVNPFRAPEEVIALIQRLTGMAHRGTRVLHSSLSFLNRRNVTTPPRKLALFAGGNEIFLAIFNFALRRCDRTFGTRLSHYGWAFYFGGLPPGALEPWMNVCVRCGSGHSEDFLRQRAGIRRHWAIFETYRCPSCGGFNLLA